MIGKARTLIQQHDALGVAYNEIPGDSWLFASNQMLHIQCGGHMPPWDPVSWRLLTNGHQVPGDEIPGYEV